MGQVSIAWPRVTRCWAVLDLDMGFPCITSENGHKNGFPASSFFFLPGGYFQWQLLNNECENKRIIPLFWYSRIQRFNCQKFVFRWEMDFNCTPFSLRIPWFIVGSAHQLYCSKVFFYTFISMSSVFAIN